MLKVLRARIHQGHQTTGYPAKMPNLPARFRGQLQIDRARCPDGCTACVEACPTGAITGAGQRDLKLDLGRCIFCTECVAACPVGAIVSTNEFRMSARKREGLVVSDREKVLAEALDGRMRSLFGRSLKLRQVSAAGCNGCEVEVNALSNVVFDLGRFGIQFVASPRHADGLLITGPVSQNMKLALQKTYEAVPAPKIVIAAGACAISGGPFRGHAEVNDGADSIVPVDLYVPGCPPHPLTLLDALLRLLGRIEDRVGASR
ncbi:MAG: NADH-quinone oxidoreductase subunit NuoB [Chloroflexi bacterium]|nr:NADH-quinone oxidoreductase subunit NuoB [Chloroflexota bacterium]